MAKNVTMVELMMPDFVLEGVTGYLERSGMLDVIKFSDEGQYIPDAPAVYMVVPNKKAMAEAKAAAGE